MTLMFFVCGKYTLEHNRKLITDFVKQAYLAYFKVKLSDQDKSWAPQIACKTCIEFYGNGQRNKGKVWGLQFRWGGESQKIFTVTATFAE